MLWHSRTRDVGLDLDPVAAVDRGYTDIQTEKGEGGGGVVFFSLKMRQGRREARGFVKKTRCERKRGERQRK